MPLLLHHNTTNNLMISHNITQQGQLLSKRIYKRIIDYGICQLFDAIGKKFPRSNLPR